VIRILTFSEAGGDHPANEDAFAAGPLGGDPDRVYVVVADGQGGRAGGAAAARLVCDTVSRALDSRGGYWPDVLSRADRAAAAEPVAGFTTLAGLSVEGDCLSGASCGDSAVLAVSGSGASSEVTAGQLKNPPAGSGGAVFVPFMTDLVRPWRILAMTDGVWKYVGWPRVRELATSLGGQELVAALQAAARLPKSGQFPDDFTVVLLEAE
jgi:serine/threonine protein phosphatase PrpC